MTTHRSPDQPDQPPDGLPADPFALGDARLDLLSDGSRLTDYLLEAPTEAECVRRLKGLRKDDLRCVAWQYVYPEWRDKGR